jgi:hypothetical protein
MLEKSLLVAPARSTLNVLPLPLLCVFAGMNDAIIILMICVGFYQATTNIRNVWAYDASSMPARVSSVTMGCCPATAMIWIVLQGLHVVDAPVVCA